MDSHELDDNQRKGLIISVVVVVCFYLLFVWWPASYDRKHPQIKETCKQTSKKQEVITKLDGGVASYETEVVYGCQYPDGTFIPEPLPD